MFGYVNDCLHVIRMQILGSNLIPWHGFDPCLPTLTSYRLMHAYTEALSSCHGILRASSPDRSGGCSVCLLLLLFDVSKRSCNEKTIINVSRTGKLPYSPPVESLVRNTAEPSSRASWREKPCAYTRPECNAL